ncbi:unnamed protein product [Camellia sinensis]
MKYRDRLHKLAKAQIEKKDSSTEEWKIVMERSFNRMNNEVIAWNDSVLHTDCWCELQKSECNTVGSMVVVAVVTPDKIIVSNCGDSRAVLCCNDNAISLSTDHKLDWSDELSRIQAVGRRVIYWDGPQVLGVLAVSRGIGSILPNGWIRSVTELSLEETECDKWIWVWSMKDDCFEWSGKVQPSTFAKGLTRNGDPKQLNGEMRFLSHWP